MHVVFLYFAIGVVLAGGTGRRWLIAGWGPAFLAALVFVGCLGYFLALFYGAYPAGPSPLVGEAATPESRSSSRDLENVACLLARPGAA